MSRLSNRKAPGPDCIPNEFLKNLPYEAVLATAECFSAILETESTPTEWSNSVTVMIHKKGDVMNPNNYRPIALLNTYLKLFTQILHDRIATWALESGILSEAQGGFRKGRGCEDQIFVLNSAVQLALQKKSEKVYALFIDFARAFPSIPHDLLWDKLFSIGLSGKIIRILRHFHHHLTTQIRLPGTLSTPIEITEGLAQGEVLSPRLFSLYICDIEEILQQFGVSGIEINSDCCIHILLYADDMVVLSNTKLGLQMKIRRLERYFDKNQLVVHLSKTKVIVFRKGGRLPNNTTCRYKGQNIEVVSEYTYLGVPFSSSGLFRKANKHFKSKGNATMGAVWKIIYSSRLEPLWSKTTLFKAVTLASVLYCCHIWGIRYLAEIEKVQNQFLRRLLGLSYNSPTYLMRLETGFTKLRVRVIKQALTFITKILASSPDRYTHHCFHALLRRSSTDSKPDAYNWVTQIRNLLHPILPRQDWNSLTHEDLKLRVSGIVDACKLNSFIEDKDRIAYSSTYLYCQTFDYQFAQPAEYLRIPLPTQAMRLIAQSRIGNGKFSVYGDTFFLNREESCTICSLHETKTLYHILFRCAVNLGPKTAFLHGLPAPKESEWWTILNILEKSTAFRYARFISTCLSHYRDIPDD
jgi:hypothetical protein